MRFTGAVEDVAGAVVEAAVEEEGGEAVGILEAKLAGVEEADVSLEKDDILGIGGVERLGEVTSGVLFGAGAEGSVKTVLDGGLEAGDKGFDPSEEGGEAIGLEMS